MPSVFFSVIVTDEISLSYGVIWFLSIHYWSDKQYFFLFTTAIQDCYAWNASRYRLLFYSLGATVHLSLRRRITELQISPVTVPGAVCLNSILLTCKFVLIVLCIGKWSVPRPAARYRRCFSLGKSSIAYVYYTELRKNPSQSHTIVSSLHCLLLLGYIAIYFKHSILRNCLESWLNSANIQDITINQYSLVDHDQYLISIYYIQ